MEWRKAADLDVDPFLFEQGLKFVHEDAFRHGGLREWEIGRLEVI
jgi:hypothetical protein